jgi:hypothetical protein
MANPCVSQADCHSATTASVIWLLAIDFIFILCVSPCPGILILDVVQMRSFLDWSLTGAVGFSHLYLHHHWSSGQGGLIESHFRFEKYCDPGDSWMYLLNKYKIKLGWEFIFLISLVGICILNTFNYFYWIKK